MKNKINTNFAVDAHTSLYCIFGNPVKHSLSPVMQNAAFRKAGINAVYTAFEIQDIRSGLSAMRSLNIHGASVTIPFKKKVLKYTDITEPAAREIGAVNTLLNKNGTIYGYNTDGKGAVLALLNAKIRLEKQKTLIIGNGGSARAVSFSLLDEGADIIIAGRNQKNIQNLTRNLNRKRKVNHILLDNIDSKFMRDIDIIINTTPVGMSPDIKECPVNQNLLLKKHTVFDIIYSPHNTSLLKAAEKKGCRIIHGIEMLINQGAAQFEIWTGMKAPLDIMRNAAAKLITKK
ncbi:MAG: shikimate dehydrogenase [Spirochaetes bacterium]|nr:shikimate dehydrogenase [Spirochaetota bacterium]